MSSVRASRSLWCVLAFASLWVISGIAQCADPWMGTWKANMAKSKYVPGPAPKSAAHKWEPAPGRGFKHSTDQADAQGPSLFEPKRTS